jgi:apolipoprotein N-acyltransferase
VRARTSLGPRQVIVRDVALRTGATVYERVGDLPVLIVSGALVLIGWFAALGSDVDFARTDSARRAPRRSRTRARP